MSPGQQEWVHSDSKKGFFGSMPITWAQGTHLPPKPNQKESSIAFAETQYHTGTVVFIDIFWCDE